MADARVAPAILYERFRGLEFHILSALHPRQNMYFCSDEVACGRIVVGSSVATEVLGNGRTDTIDLSQVQRIPVVADNTPATQPCASAACAILCCFAIDSLCGIQRINQIVVIISFSRSVPRSLDVTEVLDASSIVRNTTCILEKLRVCGVINLTDVISGESLESSYLLSCRSCAIDLNISQTESNSVRKFASFCIKCTFCNCNCNIISYL